MFDTEYLDSDVEEETTEYSDSDVEEETTEYSDSDVDEETLAWIDSHPQLGLNAQNFGLLWQGAVVSVPPNIIGENNIEAHVKETLTKILRACSRDEVDLITDTQDAIDLISRKLLILEQSERLRREQELERTARRRANNTIRSQRRRARLPDEERRTSERIRSQRRREADRTQFNEYMAQYMAQYRAGMSEEQRAQFNAYMVQYRAGMSEEQHAQFNAYMVQYRAGMSEEQRAQWAQYMAQYMAQFRADMTEEQQRQVNQQSRERMARLRSRRRGERGPLGIACNCNMDMFNPGNPIIVPHELGMMGGSDERICSHCNAKGYECEMMGTRAEPHMGQLCCNQGKIELPTPSPFPIELYKLLTEQTAEAKEFRKRIRYFNSGMAAASLEVKDASIYKFGTGAFRVHGQLYSRIGPPLTSNVYGRGRPKCLQIFFFDAEEQANIRTERSYGPRRSDVVMCMDRSIFQKLQRILVESNSYIRSYLTINEEIQRREIDPDTVQLVIDPAPTGNQHRGRFNVPGANEISVLLADDDASGVDRHAIITPMRQEDPNTNPIRRIPDHHRAHDPLLYPILTPNGEDGWYRGLLSKGEKVSMMQYWSYQVMDRDRNLIDPNDGQQIV